MTTSRPTTLELPVKGMDCAACAQHVEGAIARLPGVQTVQVLLSAERATVAFDPAQVNLEQIRTAVAQAGYSIPDPGSETEDKAASTAPGPRLASLSSLGWAALGLVALVVIGAAIGERMGLFDRVVDRLPWWLPALAIVLGGWPVLRNVVQAALQRQITSHTLMTLGVVAAASIGQWTTAALLVFFMRFGDWIESLTTSRSRQALQALIAQQPARARVVQEGQEVEVAVGQIAAGDVVAVRPGERIPVDGTVILGGAPVDQGPITGESVPVDKLPGDSVFAATIVQGGYLHVRATSVGQDTAFAHIVRLVEEAETHKAPVQRFADRFASYYMPLVLGIAVLTYLVTGQLLNAVAVLVVTCACAITMATPVVVLASVGAAARRGLLIKGGLTLESLARVDTLVMDKTGTLTWGSPQVTEVIPLNGLARSSLLQSVAAVEARSEHPLARALVRAARTDGLTLPEVAQFTAVAGRGVFATLDGQLWTVGNRRLLDDQGCPVSEGAEAQAQALEAAGQTVFFVARAGEAVGLVALADAVRPEVKLALASLRQLGVRRQMLLTGDHERVAAAVAGELGLEYRAGLLPDDKIRWVRDLQAQGGRVMMIGDGVNDAPALAQADVGVAMGVAGTDVALDAADIALLRDDWRLVPEAVQLGRRATGTIRQNLGFTAVYNLLGISLAFLGILPPVWAAAAQSIPDIAIMLNSARLASWRGGHR